MTTSLALDGAHQHGWDYANDSPEFLEAVGPFVVDFRYHLADYVITVLDAATAAVVDTVTITGGGGGYLAKGDPGRWLLAQSGTDFRDVAVDAATGAITIVGPVTVDSSDWYPVDARRSFAWRVDATHWAVLAVTAPDALSLRLLDLTDGTFTDLGDVQTGYMAPTDGTDYPDYAGAAGQVDVGLGWVTWRDPHEDGVTETITQHLAVYDGTGSIVHGPVDLYSSDHPDGGSWTHEIRWYTQGACDGAGTALVHAGGMSDSSDTDDGWVDGRVVVVTDSAVSDLPEPANTALYVFGAVDFFGTATAGLGQSQVVGEPFLWPHAIGKVVGQAWTLDGSGVPTDVRVLTVDIATGAIDEDAEAPTDPGGGALSHLFLEGASLRVPDGAYFANIAEFDGSSVRSDTGTHLTAVTLSPAELAGEAEVTIEAVGALTVDNEGLHSWDADESQKAQVVIEARGLLTVTPTVVAPPAGVTLAMLRRVSLVMPTPTLDARGRPT